MTHEPQQQHKISPEELNEMIRQFNETTLQLQQAYARLQAQVTELKRELEQKNRELQRKKRLEELGQMAAGVAHEIRNPLGGIQLYAGMLERDLKENPDGLRIVQKISTGIKQLNAIVEDLLAFTRDHAPQFAMCDIQAVVQEALFYVEAQLKQKQITVSYEMGGGHAVVMGDAGALQRVFLNLLLNAEQAMVAGGALQVRITQVPEKVTVAVADSGCGIPDDIMDKIFNPFFTRKEKGTGLGLAIVHRVVEAHGGEIAVRNRPEGGAEFVVTLPKQPGKAQV